MSSYTIVKNNAGAILARCLLLLLFLSLLISLLVSNWKTGHKSDGFALGYKALYETCEQLL